VRALKEKPWKNYIENYTVICVTDGTYGARLKEGTFDEALQKILSKSQVLEESPGEYYKVRFNDIDIVIFNPTRTLIFISLGEKYDRIEDFLKELFS